MISFNQHIMWYEVDMVQETFHSLMDALQHAPETPTINLCFNSQTYIEEPLAGIEIKALFDKLQTHEIFQKHKINVLQKTNKDPFYNIGDWRRDMYDPKDTYTVWGESDCLIPYDLFYILQNASQTINHQHILSFASRKMWDGSWAEVEHKDLKQYKGTKESPFAAPVPFNSSDVINQQQLNEFNDRFDIEIIRLAKQKIDGSLLCLSGNLPTPFISPKMNFVREDTCAELFFKYMNIPQYHVTTRLKGHNYSHPQKRKFTSSTRDDEAFKKYAKISEDALHEFIDNL